ncbi:hypothetical protein MOF25_00475 [Bacillus atrophaeus]|uniref:hypothetical protein n=1 Tax=Bacillus atrophaeus TaxID=1452 RepID=UPI0022827722|nr:hypothetical protein [Bacillus atrophaeus]MCY9158848.1 hypothetical protein [Bacillus atrophaeus]
MTIENSTLTLEQAARVLGDFNIVFTVEGVKTKIQLRQLTALQSHSRIDVIIQVILT